VNPRHAAASVPLIIVIAAPGALGAGTLYDASLGTLPSAQGWQFQADPNNGPVSQQVGAGLLTLTTSLERADRAGYPSRLPTVPPFPAFPNHPLIGTLDRQAGFTVRIDARIITEGHNARDDNADGLYDRAGFSLLVVCHDLRAIEIGFWTDRVWAQDDDAVSAADLFTQAEGVALSTTAGVRTYELSVSGDSYRLFADGAPILGGPLRDYGNATGLAGYVYRTQDLIFFGDDTGSADASAQIALVTLGASPKSGPACPGDIDWSGVTDIYDFAELAASFSQAVPLGTRGDLDLDGDVDVFDFAIMGAGFGCVQ
jgi:hypothetical protein